MSKFELKDVHGEDVEDIILQIEKSLNVTFPDDAFKDVLTFGDLVQAIKDNLNTKHAGNCTSQQAFYKVKSALQKINPDLEVIPNLDLALIFPKSNRRTKIREFIEFLGIEISLLKPHTFIYNAGISILLIGVILVFLIPSVGVSAIIFSLFTMWVANQLGTDFRVDTLGEVCKILANENYNLVRSNSTINRNEIWSLVESHFQTLELTEKLTADSKFGWAN